MTSKAERLINQKLRGNFLKYNNYTFEHYYSRKPEDLDDLFSGIIAMNIRIELENP